MKAKIPFLACLLLMLSFSASAKIAGHNVILIHGLQPLDLLPHSPINLNSSSSRGWAPGSTLGRIGDGAINWDGGQRIEGKIAMQVYQQVKNIARQRLCENYCILVSHSAGDIVTRYMIENQARWLKADGLPPLKILCALDFAGSGGGTEPANIVVSAGYMGSAAMSLPVVRQALSILGIPPLSPDNLGVIIDEQTTTARQLSVTPSSVPHFRIVAQLPLSSQLTSFFNSIGLPASLSLYSARGI